MKRRGILTTLCLTAFVAGCASSPSPPREQLAAADLAVRQVQGPAVSTYAAGEVRQARNKLETAKEAMRNEDFLRARRMAEQALVDAQLADVSADAARSGETLAQSEKSIEALEREALELSR